MCVGLFPTYATALDDAEKNRNGRLQNIKLVLRHSLFGPSCRTPCAMGPYTCNRWIKHFSVCCLYASIYNGCRVRDVNLWNGQKFEFFRTFWPTLWKPLGQPKWLNARMCAGLCPTYATALDDAEENRNGRWLSCSRRNPQNWYYVTHFLAHPIERRDR